MVSLASTNFSATAWAFGVTQSAASAIVSGYVLVLLGRRAGLSFLRDVRPEKVAPQVLTALGLMILLAASVGYLFLQGQHQANLQQCLTGPRQIHGSCVAAANSRIHPYYVEDYVLAVIGTLLLPLALVYRSISRKRLKHQAGRGTETDDERNL